MEPGILWLVRLGTEQGLFTLDQVKSVQRKLGDKASLLDFAQQLIDDELVADCPSLERIAGIALARGEQGPPPRDAPPADSDAPFSTDSSAPFALKAKDLAAEAKAKGPPLSFDALKALGDDALPEAMRELLAWAARSGASDLHLSAGTAPFVRRNRELEVISSHNLGAEESLRLNCALLSPEQRKDYLEKRDLDLALAPGGKSGRCRANLMFHKKGSAGAYRLVPRRAPTLAALGFGAHQKTIDRLLSYHNGLVLVTGPVGSGKTTTLAALLAQLNAGRDDHIITVEDPIEFVHAAGRCNVTQRQVGSHTRTFHSALKGALREDPDIIVIGELRDLETIEMAVSAAETGHLVLATMHTSDAATTLNRLLDVFPPGQQAQIRASVAESLRGVVCQRLLPKAGGGLTLACEILINNTAISNLIREGKTTGLRNSMETGVREGMCLMDNVVFSLWQQQQITADTALATINNRVLRARIN